jgi:hypothetical protein
MARRLITDWSAREDAMKAPCGAPRRQDNGRKKWSLLVLMDWNAGGERISSYARLLIHEGDGGQLITNIGRVFPITENDMAEDDGA